MTETVVVKPLESAAVDGLRENFRGGLLVPGDEGYDSARALWNAMHDKRPALIAQCNGVADVVAALRFARERQLEIAVRGGGHNVAGKSSTDGGVMIDLSSMRGVRVDPAARRAWVQAGALLGDVDRETQHFGLVSPGGFVSHTGVAGLTLGGGHGWTQRKLGMACDNVVTYDVVTAEGEFVRASADENAELFWGLRGGGGNFGIVTGFEFQLHLAGPIIYGGPVFYAAEDSPAVLEFFRSLTAEAPDDLTCSVLMLCGPPAPFLPESVHGKPLVAFATCNIGDFDEAERLTAPLRTIAKPVGDLLGPMPYVALQSALDDWQCHGVNRYWKSRYLSEISDGAIDTWVSHNAELHDGCAMSGAYYEHVGGAIASVGEGDSAFAHRKAVFDFTAMAGWVDAADADANMSWGQTFWTDLDGVVSSEVYVNNLDNEGQDRVRAAYGPAKYDRLVALKRKLDPDNVFHLNQNIAP